MYIYIYIYIAFLCLGVFFMFNHFTLKGKSQMVWPGLTKPIKLGLQDRKDKDQFETDVKYNQGDERTRFPGMKVRGWSGRAWPGKHVGPPQTHHGGLCSFLPLCFHRFR